jgi:Flp pilus assembly protein TadG
MRHGNQSVLLQAGRRWLAMLASRRALADEAGNALIEVALVLSILGVPLLTGTIYFGVMLLDSIIVTNAAHAAAEYGMTSSTLAQNNSEIIAAAQAEATGLGVTLNVTPNNYYACSAAIGGTQYSTQAAANTACTGGTNNHALEFLQVTTSATVTPPYRFPGLSKTVTLTGTSVQEVEE